MVTAAAFLLLVVLVCGEYTDQEAREDWNRDRAQLKAQGFLPAFLTPQVASVCRALIGDLCPRPQRIPYHEGDSSDHPLMANSKKHDLRFKFQGGDSDRHEVEIAHPARAAWPAPGEKPRHVGEKFLSADEEKTLKTTIN